jgi:beta-glucosidase/6-phospho-beta-glucosidase/beta-galactosidase
MFATGIECSYPVITSKAGKDKRIDEMELCGHYDRWKEDFQIFGYYVIIKQYYDRYHLPVMHTETNLQDDRGAPQWLRKEWMNMFRLREDGVPIIGFTWYGLTDQIDWDVALRVDNGTVNPLGLYDLNRKVRPVGKAYKKLASQWRTSCTPTACVSASICRW